MSGSRNSSGPTLRRRKEGCSVYDFTNLEMDQYFYSLPPLVQQAILNSEISPETLDELRNLAGTLTE